MLYSSSLLTRVVNSKDTYVTSVSAEVGHNVMMTTSHLIHCQDTG